MDTRNETLAALLERYAGGNGLPRLVPRIRFEDALRRGDDPLHLLPYLADIGIEVRTIDDLLKIGEDQSEDEMLSFLVKEGVAVVMVQDGNWQLFEETPLWSTSCSATACRRAVTPTGAASPLSPPTYYPAGRCGSGLVLRKPAPRALVRSSVSTPCRWMTVYRRSVWEARQAVRQALVLEARRVSEARGGAAAIG